MLSLAYLIGITGLCGASTLISQVWHGSARHAAIVGQDAMFNGGGVLFAALTSWFLAQSMPFSSTYMVTFGIIIFVILLMLISDFTVPSDSEGASETNSPTEWNSRIILIGVSLLLYMMAKSLFLSGPRSTSQKNLNIRRNRQVGSLCRMSFRQH